MLGILNDSIANSVAYWVKVGVADLDQGVLGILNDNPGNATVAVDDRVGRHYRSGSDRAGLRYRSGR